MPVEYTIIPIQPHDLSFLWNMLYEAAAVAPEVRAMGQEQSLSLSTNRKYLAEWGREGDVGRIALSSQLEPQGAAWYRLFPAQEPGYGFVSIAIPELAIGVRADARGQGIGGALLQTLLNVAISQGLPGLSLSVDRQSSARRLYERYGFRNTGLSHPHATSVTLLRLP